MQIQRFIREKLLHFTRNKHKKDSINRVLNSEQFNKGVINIHRYDFSNKGDYYCGVHHYFEELNDCYLDIFDYKREDVGIRNEWVEKINNNALIIGGGGLLNRGGFDLQMKLFEHLKEKGKKTVLWGVGHNEKNSRKFGKVNSYNVNTSKFGLVGVRDYGMREEWVPCVSCLHPIFDKHYEIKHEISVIFHKKTLENKNALNKFNDFPSTANNADFEKIINTIGSSEAILTDSYHAMYWAMLLGKKVMVFPNSSKFYQFKYQPVISDFSNFRNDLKKMERYSGILEECREVNINFSKKVFDYLNL